MTQIKGLEAFCKKQGISVLGGDEFNLMEFLLAICAKTHWLAELSGRLSERISTLEKDSDEWGGCPRCGTNVHAGLSECPLCGFTLEGSLEEEKPEEVPPEKKPSRDTIKKPKPKVFERIKPP